MTQKENKPFEKFRWQVEWMKYAATLSHDEEQAFNWSVILYGLKCEEPTKLQGASLEYFNTKVRPELDRQHKKLRKGRRI